MREQMRRLMEMQALQQEKKVLLGEIERLSTDDLRVLWQDIKLLGQCIAADKERLICLKKVCERQEAELIKAAEHCRRLEAALYDGKVQSAKDLEQISGKCSAEKRELEAREEEYFRSLVQGEELAAQIAAQEKVLASKQKLHAQKRQQALKTKAEAEGKLVAMEKQLAALTREVEPGLLARYQELSRKYGAAVASISNGACTGCRRSVPTRQAACQSEIIYCDNCGRMLFVE